MFYYKNGRFYAELTPRRLSFAIPDGCWLNTMPDTEYKHLCSLLTEEKDVTIEFEVFESTVDDICEDVRNYFDTGCVGDPAPITVNGLNGYSALFKSSHTSCYIVLLDITPFNLSDEEEDCTMTRVVFAVSLKKGMDADAVIAGREVQEALNSIRIE